jgi:integrase/recombinase XerD
MNYLGKYPPSPELAKSFLAQFADRKTRTLYRYAQMIKSFMKWYGESIDDVKIKVPKTLPAYTENSDIEKMLAVIPNKRNHKDLIERDQLLVMLGWKSGLRRAELANLHVRDIHGDSLIVRNGKGKKDRLVPLTQEVTAKLHQYIKNKNSDQQVFGLTPESLGMKIKQIATKAGLSDFHTHTLRHKFATDVLESGTNIKVLQTLMGHENLNTTEVYLSLTNRELYAAAKRLDEYSKRTSEENAPESTDLQIQQIQKLLDPRNVFQALNPSDVEEVEIDTSLMIDKACADRMLKALQKNVH